MIDFQNSSDLSVETGNLLFENPANSESDFFLSPADVAHLLGVSRKFVYERMQRGDLPAQRVGRLKRIRKSALEKWLDHQQDWR